jgi:hypothetical protein
MVAIYDYMASHSEIVSPNEFFKFGIPATMTGEIRIWRGRSIDLQNEFQHNRKIVDQTITALMNTEAIQRISRGSSVTQSIYLLGNRPEVLTYESLKERSLVTGRAEIRTPTQRAEDAVNRLNQRITELEQRVERLEYAEKINALSDPRR